MSVLTEIEPGSVQETVASHHCPSCGNGHINILYRREFQGKCWSLAQCTACSLHFTDPIPTAEDIAGFYKGDYHAEFRSPGVAERILGPKFKRYVSWITRFVSSGRSLDIGCSTGLLPKMLQDAGFVSAGIELNAANASWGNQHYGVPIRSGGLEDDLAPEPLYDLVIMGDVLEHTPNPFTFLCRVNRVLKTNGFVFVSFPDITSIESSYYRLLSKLLRRPWLWITCHIPGHTWEFTPHTAKNLFARAGFEVVGFRRASLRQELEGRLKVLSFPTRITDIWPSRFGSQMEFMLRKVSVS
jgi:SAM-dependent methyltransferase